MENIGIKKEGPKRILVIDSLRGFALFGIMITHMSFLFNSVNFADLYSGNVSVSDSIVTAINTIFFLGKFYAIFAFLFGLSYFIQMDRGAQKGFDYKWRLLWRITILLVIGFLHGLLFSGDILIIYAILGIPLVFLYKLSDKILIIVTVVLLSGMPRFITYGIQQMNKDVSSNVDNKGKDEVSYGENQYEIYQNGSFIDVVKYNLVDGLVEKAKYQVNTEGRLYQTLAMFILGVLVGKRRYFERIEENLTKTRKVFKMSIWISIVLLLFTLVFYGLSKGDMKGLSFQFASTFHNFFNLSLALLIFTAFIIVYQKSKSQNFLNNLAPYGRMGLSNYLLQSIIAVPLLYGFGLGLSSKINLATGVLMGIIVFLLQLGFTKWWLKRFVYGPFEWLWRSLTWFKPQSFSRNNYIKLT